VADADLVVHVVDGSAADPEGQIEAVHRVMREIHADELPELMVVNKVDAADPDVIQDLCAAHDGALAVSARTGEEIEKLTEVVGARLRSLTPIYELLVPYERGDVLAALHRDGEVLVEVHADEGTRVRARLPQSVASRVSEFVSH
jgi:GTP-binding protein HflX